ECGESRFVGEASVWYMYSRRAAGRIHEFNPNARMIALLRNPVDMLQSIHAHHVYTGFQEIQDFRIAYQDHGTSGQSGESFRHHLDYSQIARYGDQLERFLQLSGRDSIHVSLHDDLKSDVSRVYRSIIDFLGLQPGPLPEFRRFNPQRRSRNRTVAGLHQRMTSRKAIRPRPSSWVGSMWRKGETTVNRIVGRLNAAEVIRTPVDPEMRQEIIADYRDDILKLSGLIDRDLSHWLE
ncbi:MAG: sulfotransferase domain-containing protein, partial [Acidimicrobiia bacterium]